MSVEVTLPALGESVTEGTVTRWLKEVGDTVAVDEPLLEVSTDKVDTEIPAPAAGVILEIRAGEDDVVEVGGVLAVIGLASERPSAPATAAPAPAVAPAAAAPTAAPAPTPVAAAAPPPSASPAVSSSAATGTEVTLPALGESVTEGTVTRWLKEVGEQVAVDEPLLEVSTDKVDTEIPSPAAGTLLEIRVAEDETAEVGAVLAVVGAASQAAAAPAPAAPAPAAPAPAAPAVATSPPVAPAPVNPPAPPAAVAPAAPPKRPAPSAPAPAPVAATPTPAPASATAPAANAHVYVTPIVRKIAKSAGIDLSTVIGTGVGGRIRKQDVEAAIAARAASSATSTAAAPTAPSKRPAVEVSPLRGTTVKMSRLRRVIAERMVESMQVSAQLTTVVEVDVTAISQLRAAHKEAFFARHGVKLSYLPFFAYAAVEALKAHPALNASIDTEAATVSYHGSENLGMAVDSERGLLVPVIRNAGELSIAGLASAIADLASRTRENKLSPDDLTGGTFTLTNTGSRGALFDTPIISQPQVAILGTGAVVKRPVVVADQYGTDSIAVRSMMYLSLSYDHRLVDGADAARYLTDVKARLEEGNFLAVLD